MGARLWNQNNNIVILVPRGRRSCRAPVPQRVDAPHARIHAQSARAAVRGPGAVQFVLGEQGRRSRGPCGTRCPALAASVAHCALSGAASYFFLVSEPSNSCNQFFSGNEIKPKQVRIRSCLPRARRQMRKGEAIRLSWCSAIAPC